MVEVLMQEVTMLWDQCDKCLAYQDMQKQNLKSLVDAAVVLMKLEPIRKDAGAKSLFAKVFVAGTGGGRADSRGHTEKARASDESTPVPRV